MYTINKSRYSWSPMPENGLAGFQLLHGVRTEFCLCSHSSKSSLYVSGVLVLSVTTSRLILTFIPMVEPSWRHPSDRFPAQFRLFRLIIDKDMLILISILISMFQFKLKIGQRYIVRPVLIPKLHLIDRSLTLFTSFWCPKRTSTRRNIDTSVGEWNWNNLQNQAQRSQLAPGTGLYCFDWTENEHKSLP